MSPGHVAVSAGTETRSTARLTTRLTAPLMSRFLPTRRRRAATVVALLAGLAGCSSSDARDTADANITVTTAATDATVETDTTRTTAVAAATTAGEVPAPGGSATVTTRRAMTPQGYDLVAATVTNPDGDECDVCLWLADTAPRRSRGLMGVTDLGDGDGMAFVYPSPHTGSFWMRNTMLPLSIAFFDDDGTYLDEFEMDPCTSDPCRLYPTAPEFTVAIETTQGDLGAIGIGPGSRLALSDLPCAQP